MTQFLGAQISEVPYWLQLPYTELEYILNMKQKHNNPKPSQTEGETWKANESEETKFLKANLTPDQFKELNL